MERPVVNGTRHEGLNTTSNPWFILPGIAVRATKSSIVRAHSRSMGKRCRGQKTRGSPDEGVSSDGGDAATPPSTSTLEPLPTSLFALAVAAMAACQNCGTASASYVDAPLAMQVSLAFLCHLPYRTSLLDPFRFHVAVNAHLSSSA